MIYIQFFKRNRFRMVSDMTKASTQNASLMFHILKVMLIDIDNINQAETGFLF